MSSKQKTVVKYRNRPKKKVKRRPKRRIAALPLFGGVIYPIMDSVSKANFVNEIQKPATEDKINALKGLVDQLGQHYTGFSMFPELGAQTPFQPMEAVKTYGALGAGVVGHMLASKFGVNRQLHNIPFIGKHVEL